MSILNTHYYHKTINLYTKVFGTVFNNIKIVRVDDSVIQVPISYISGQKYNTMNQEKPDPGLVRYKQKIPRMTYEITNITRDPARAKNKNFQITNHSSETTGDVVKAQYNRVPINIDYRLDIRTAYLDDMLQVIEQIHTAFDPSIQIVVKDNPDINGESAINLTLVSGELRDEIEGLFEQSRNIEYTFNFTLEGYLYRRTSGVGLIEKVIIEYKDLENFRDLAVDEINPQ